jgi:alcohol dehydrogenase class IV
MKDMNIPDNLESYFEKEEDLDRFVDLAYGGFLMLNNPRRPTKPDLMTIYRSVFKKA